MAGKPKNIDEYLALLSGDKRAALEKLRKDILAAAPKAEEGILWGLPGFRLEGRMLVAFGAASRHCALYPMSAATVAAHKDDLKDYDTSAGTIRFPALRPLPAGLVRKLVRARIAENVEKAAQSKQAKQSPACSSARPGGAGAVVCGAGSSPLWGRNHGEWRRSAGPFHTVLRRRRAVAPPAPDHACVSPVHQSTDQPLFRFSAAARTTTPGRLFRRAGRP